MAIGAKTKLAINSSFVTAQNTIELPSDEKNYLISSEGKQRTLKKSIIVPKTLDTYAVSFSDGSKLNVTGDTKLKLSTSVDRMMEEDGECDTHHVDIRHILKTMDEEWAYPLTTVYKGRQNDNTALITPYILGLWAAGIIREDHITASLQTDCYEELSERGFHLYPILGEYDITSFMLGNYLPEIGVTNHSVPQAYLFAPIEDRIDLLKGITAHSNKSHRATVTLITENLQLISNIRSLLASIGVSSRIKVSSRAEHTTYFTIIFPNDFWNMNRDLEWNRITHIEKIPHTQDFYDIRVTNKHKDIAVGETFIPVVAH